MVLFSPSSFPVRAKLVSHGGRPFLVASFETSVPPALWQFDLGKMPNAVWSLREKEGEWDLCMSSVSGNFAPIAHFEEHMEAEKAFSCLKKAMFRSHGFPLRFPSLKIVFFVLIALGVLFFLFRPGAPAPEQSAARTTVTENKEAPAFEGIVPGVPMNADDVLTMPED